MASSHVRFFSILKKRGVSMVFHSKIDNAYRAILGCVCVIMALSFLLPMTLDDNFTKQDGILLGSILLLTTLFIVWVMVDIRYELREDELYVRGGPILPASHILLSEKYESLMDSPVALPLPLQRRG